MGPPYNLSARDPTRRFHLQQRRFDFFLSQVNSSAGWMGRPGGSSESGSKAFWWFEQKPSSLGTVTPLVFLTKIKIVIILPK